MKRAKVIAIVALLTIGILIYIFTSGYVDIKQEDIGTFNITKGKDALEILGFVPYWAVPKHIPPIDYIALFSLEPTQEGWKNPFHKIPHIPEGTKLLWTLKIHGDEHTSWMDTPDGIASMMEKLSIYMDRADGIVLNLEDWSKYLRIDDIIGAFHNRYPTKLIMITLPSWGLPITGNIQSFTDRFILMAYDYDFKNGILAPIDKVENSIRFYSWLSDKLLLGIPLYGYQRLDTSWNAIQIRQIENSTRTHTEGKEAITQGRYGPVVWNDLQTIDNKIKLARQYKLRGIALWALGYTSDTFIESIMKMAYTSSTATR